MDVRTYRKGATSSPHHLASQSGLDILKDGGNAVEACVGMAATLAVVYPHMTGLGGDGFWMVSEPDGSVHAIHACGAAASAVSVDFYKDRGHKTIPWRGPLAALTPAGTVSGWQEALDATGSKLSLSRILRDAIHYAQEGVEVTAGGAETAASKDSELKDVSGYADVFRPGARPLSKGSLLKQPALARTLKRLCEAGLRDIYEGELAKDIAADLARAGSPLTAADLASQRAERLAPLTVRVREGELFNTGPPTQGMTSLLILALFDRFEPASPDSFAHIHTLVEATKQAFIRYKEVGLGDPAYMATNAQTQLDDSEQLQRLGERIALDKALPWPHVSEPGDTTWFGAADADGRVVSAIQSTYFEFGSGVVLPETGITWQNRGTSFSLHEDGWNALKPRRKPFHTLNPALARLNDGRTLAYGTMGGEGQPQTQAAIFTRYARYGIPLEDAIAAPRWLLGRTWGERSVSLKLEGRFPSDLCDDLHTAGHDVEIVKDFSTVMGHAGAVCRHSDGTVEAASDPRSDGSALAW